MIQLIASSLLLLPFGLAPDSLLGESGGEGSQQVPVAKEAPAQRGAPFLWQVQGQGATAYLFGTIHAPDKRVTNLPDSVVSAFNESDSFFAELEATPQTIQKVQKLAALPAGKSLPVIVGAETWARVLTRFKKVQAPKAVVAHYAGNQPWVIAAQLPQLEYLKEQLKGEPVLDALLYQRAKADGKNVFGLETVEEQCAVFGSFTDAEQVTMLRDALDLLDEADAEGKSYMGELVKTWLSGKEAALLELLEDGFGKDPAIRKRAEYGLLWDRNHRFAERIHNHIIAAPDKVGFFAIGVLHMPDPAKEPAPAADVANADKAAKKPVAKRGVVSLLRDRGYTVTRVGQPAAVPAGAGK